MITNDSDYPSISNLKDHKLQENIPAIVYTSVLLVAGVPGNILVCYVYSKWTDLNTTKVFILALAATDLLNCLVTLPTEIAMMSQPITFDVTVVCKLSRFFTYFCNTISALIMVMIAADRYQRICTPSKTKLNMKQAKFGIVIIIVVSVSCTWPALVMYGTNTTVVSLNVFVKNCLVENRFANSPFILSYFAFHCIATITIFIIISVLYSFVGLTVYKQWKFRRQIANSGSRDLLVNTLRNRNSQDNNLEPSTGIETISVLPRNSRRRSFKQKLSLEKTTVMLFVVTLTYIISFIPFLVLAIHRSLHPKAWNHLSHAGEMAYQVFLRSYLFNSAVNPVIYSYCSKMFRAECKKLFCR